MLTELRVRNPNRAALDQLNLPLREAGPYRIVFIDGLNPVAAEFSSSPYAILPGEYLQSSRVGVRNIVLTLELKPKWHLGEDPESLRRDLYAYFAPQNAVELTFVTDSRTRAISGVIESFEAPLFVREPQIQISILCHDPYFTDPILGTSSYEARVTNGGEWNVNNEGDVPVGFRLEVRTETAFDGMMVRVNFPGGYFGVTTPIPIGHRMVFDSRDRMKDVRNLSSGMTFFDKIMPGSTWLQLSPGNNVLEVVGGNPTYQSINNLTLTFDRRYVGL